LFRRITVHGPSRHRKARRYTGIGCSCARPAQRVSAQFNPILVPVTGPDPVNAKRIATYRFPTAGPVPERFEFRREAGDVPPLGPRWGLSYREGGGQSDPARAQRIRADRISGRGKRPYRPFVTAREAGWRRRFAATGERHNDKDSA